MFSIARYGRNFIDCESDSTAFVGMFALARRARVGLYREACVSYQDNLQSRKTGLISKAVTVSRAELPLWVQLGKVWWEVRGRRQKVSYRNMDSFGSGTGCRRFSHLQAFSPWRLPGGRVELPERKRSWAVKEGQVCPPQQAPLRGLPTHWGCAREARSGPCLCKQDHAGVVVMRWSKEETWLSGTTTPLLQPPCSWPGDIGADLARFQAKTSWSQSLSNPVLEFWI